MIECFLERAEWLRITIRKRRCFRYFKKYGKLGINSENNKDTNQPLNSACLENRCLCVYWFTKRGWKQNQSHRSWVTPCLGASICILALLSRVLDNKSRWKMLLELNLLNFIPRGHAVRRKFSFFQVLEKTRVSSKKLLSPSTIPATAFTAC